MHLSRVALLCLGLSVLLLPSSRASSQTRYRLQCKSAVGDRCTVVADDEFNCALLASVQGREAPEVTISLAASTKYTQVAMAVSPAGRITKLRRFHEKAEETVYVPTRGPIDKTSALQGRTVVVGLTNGKATVSADRPGLSAADKVEAAGWLGQDLQGLLPADEVAVGDEWDVTAGALGRLFAGMKVASAQVRARLVEVVSDAGHPCARIELSGPVKAKAPGLDAVLSLKLAGSTWLALDLARFVRLDMACPLEAVGTVQSHGMKIAVVGSGQLSAKEETTWLQADGKPVEELK